MKYGIIANGSVTEPTCIPQAHENAPIAWLKKFRGTIGNWATNPETGDWALVPDWAVPGTKDNGDGMFAEQPAAEPPTPPQSNAELILERLSAMTDEVAAIKETVNALAQREGGMISSGRVQQCRYARPRAALTALAYRS